MNAQAKPTHRIVHTEIEAIELCNEAMMDAGASEASRCAARITREIAPCLFRALEAEQRRGTSRDAAIMAGLNVSAMMALTIICSAVNSHTNATSAAVLEQLARYAESKAARLRGQVRP